MCRKSHYEMTIKMTSPLSIIVLVIWTSTFCPSWPNNVNPPSMIGYIIDIYDQIKTIYKLTLKGNWSQTIYHFSFTRGQVERKKRLYTLRSTWIKPMIGLVQFQNDCFVYNGLQLLTVMSKKHWGHLCIDNQLTWDVWFGSDLIIRVENLEPRGPRSIKV